MVTVRYLSRIELVRQTLYHLLDLLAQIAPDWLKMQVNSDWYECCSQRISNYRLLKQNEEQIALTETIDRDGFHLLEKIYAGDTYFFSVRFLLGKPCRKYGYKTTFTITISIIGVGKGTFLPPV